MFTGILRREAWAREAVRACWASGRESVGGARRESSGEDAEALGSDVVIVVDFAVRSSVRTEVESGS